MRAGPRYSNGLCRFIVWAPLAEQPRLRITFPGEQDIPMVQLNKGYWGASVPVNDGCRYLFDLGKGRLRPDPASHYQPDGVHGASEVIDHSRFCWTDQGWQGFALENAVLYELHVGTFTPEGSFDAVIPRLDELVELGINAIELMPVAQFSGSRNWGYDGTFLYSVQNSYGGPDGLKRLVDACHSRGLAVILDAVYNHLGPEGNYLSDFGPYFTDRCTTPWGQSVNYDVADSDEVRSFVVTNMLFWFQAYHIDCLRLDAIQHVYDESARHILSELSLAARHLSRLKKRRFHLTAESDLNDPRVITDREHGGYAIDSQWLDDFHHCVHTLLTGEKTGYYGDYGTMAQLAKSLTDGFVYTWHYSRNRRKHYGSSSAGLPAGRFIAFNQNHDQIGNRLLGERLSSLVSFEALKAAAGLLLCSPYAALLFMGEEYAEQAPFQYFVDHTDAALVKAVEQGRKNEFKDFDWEKEPPAPQAQETFARSRLRWEGRYSGQGAKMLEYYKALISLRRRFPAVPAGRPHVHLLAVDEASRSLAFARGGQGAAFVCCANLGPESAVLTVGVRAASTRALDSSDGEWFGPGSIAPRSLKPGLQAVSLRPHSFVVYAST